MYSPQYWLHKYSHVVYTHTLLCAANGLVAMTTTPATATASSTRVHENVTHDMQIVTHRINKSPTPEPLEKERLTCNREPIHVVDQIDEAQHTDGKPFRHADGGQAAFAVMPHRLRRTAQHRDRCSGSGDAAIAVMMMMMWMAGHRVGGRVRITVYDQMLRRFGGRYSTTTAVADAVGVLIGVTNHDDAKLWRLSMTLWCVVSGGQIDNG